MEKEKKIIISSILIIALLVLFIIIFGFSSQNGKTSSSLSKVITQKVIQMLDKLPKDLNFNNLEYILRKLAHFSLYMLGGLLLMSLMCMFTVKDMYRISISLGIGLLYAISDELHQLFVPGRDARGTDVMIDMLGVFLGVCIIFIFKSIRKRMLNNKLRKELI